MLHIPSINEGALLATAMLLAFAAGEDIRTKRIPNSITFPCIIMGLCYTLLLVRGELFIRFISIAGIFLFGTAGLIGLGDIKLMMVVAAFNHPIITFSSIAAAAILLLLSSVIRTPRQTLDRFKRALRNYKQGVRASKDSDAAIPFAPYLLAGYILIGGIALCESVL